MRKIMFLLLLFFVSLVIMKASVPKSDTESKEALGKLLFFDPILSADSSISCASCHKPEYAFADTMAFSLGVNGRKGKRNTPTAMNVRLHQQFFWDGRASSLEEQALEPIANPDEMNLPLDSAISRLLRHPDYTDAFLKIFSEKPSKKNLALAIAAFERQLETSSSAFDYWKFRGDEQAVSASVKRGFELFNTRGKCIKCHFGADFTANEFRNIGLFDGMLLNDSGRASISHKIEDIGKFKTAGLRNIAITSPYMHDGRFKTLMEVLRFYNDPEKLVPGSLNRDTLLLKPLGLSDSELQDLESFLVSLTDKRFIK